MIEDDRRRHGGTKNRCFGENANTLDTIEYYGVDKWMLFFPAVADEEGESRLKFARELL